jgi:hypothetical protein
VVKIPNGAIRYKPDMTPQEIRAALSAAGIDASAAGGGSRQAQAGGAPAAPSGGGAPGGTPQGGGMRAGGAGGQGGQPAGGARQFGRGGGGGDQPGGGNPGAAPREQRTDTAIVWKRLADGKTLQPVQIKTGITDHTVTEVVQVMKGSLNPGDEVVVGSTSGGGAAGRPPGMMGGGRPPGR